MRAEKDSRNKYKVKNNYSILFCFCMCFCGLLMPIYFLIVFYFFLLLSIFLCVVFCSGLLLIHLLSPVLDAIYIKVYINTKLKWCVGIGDYCRSSEFFS